MTSCGADGLPSRLAPSDGISRGPVAWSTDVEHAASNAAESQAAERRRRANEDIEVGGRGSGAAGAGAGKVEPTFRRSAAERRAPNCHIMLQGCDRVGL